VYDRRPRSTFRRSLAQPPRSEDPDQQLYLESLVGQLTGWNNPRQRLDRAFKHNEFILYQQRIEPLQEGHRTTFVEVLVRHQDEERHLTPPGAFLPALEYYGMMPTLDRWVSRRVLEWYAPRAKGRAIRFSINVVPQTLSDPAMATFVKALLKKHHVPAGTLCFETPDSHLAAHGEAMRPVAQALQALGCRIAIGSVGRESVSFKQIHAIGANFVKVDGALVREMHRDEVAVAKVRALHRVCHAAGMQTVAEFVEEPDTLGKLRSIGVNFAQGFGISKPAPLADME
jgi:EAL domain-containing protein (putative c-di-GMP-specific phosphodiesterase class I)